MGKFGSTDTEARAYCGVYSDDQLIMKWNAAWDECNDAGNNDPIACTGAWIDNEWNGMTPDGSGAVWHYKIVWVGSCGTYGTALPDGGYCIWGQYEVLMDHGLDSSFGPGHLWFAHAVSNGYGDN